MFHPFSTSTPGRPRLRSTTTGLGAVLLGPVLLTGLDEPALGAPRRLGPGSAGPGGVPSPQGLPGILAPGPGHGHLRGVRGLDTTSAAH